MVYFGLTSKSFRVSRIGELLREPGKEGVVRCEVVKGNHITRFGVSVNNGKTVRYLGNKPCKSMEFFKSAAVIAFTARSKNLVEGSPDDRRRFLDRMVAYRDPYHVLTLARYRKGHSQLRRILHGDRNLKVYRGFKAGLLPVARKIAQQRLKFLNDIRERASQIYASVFSGEGSLYFAYKTRNVEHIDQLEKRMMDLCAQEVLHGRSMVGPHLDDMEILVEKNRARRRASSGQVRAIVLSLKMAVRESYKNTLGYHPILLLDDVDAELDPRRLEGLISYLSGRGQTLITTSKYGTITGDKRSCVFEVSAGRISPLRNGE